MGGVGSFDKDCRTLYVSGLQLRSNLEEILNREFGEWGDLEVSTTININNFFSSLHPPSGSKDYSETSHCFYHVHKSTLRGICQGMSSHDH